MLSIRPATYADLEAIESIYDNARCIMRQTGNMHQWVNGYPSRETITADLNAGHLFVCEENSEILGVFCFFIGNDPTYEKIYDGAWLKTGESGVIHRIAVAAPGKGVAKYCFDYAFSQCGNIRIDTHRDNAPMHKALLKNGFTRCGIIYLEPDNDPRIAFEKVR
jgi:RimJ/RimL family protein N-acetyltransferase